MSDVANPLHIVDVFRKHIEYIVRIIDNEFDIYTA
jgi:hypothetical protein